MKVVVCSSCGESKEHEANGLCNKCYDVDYMAKNRSMVTEQKRQWYLRKVAKEPTHFVRKNYRNKLGVSKEELLRLLGDVCVTCGSKDRLHAHHKDHNGSNKLKAERNNSTDNLEWQCIHCHGRLHGSIDGWSRKHSKCVECHTTELKHQAHGRCYVCHYTYYNALKSTKR